jgi:hypothetical protein
MKKTSPIIILPILLLLIFLTGCGNRAQTPISATIIAITATPDMCAPGNIQTAVNKVHTHMREFDDASSLAVSLPRDQLSSQIADLQKIRRGAEDEPIPSCLANLKTYQITHMNTVINTLLLFMSGGSQQQVDQGIALARQQHDQYALELAHLLGITVVPATAGTLIPPLSATPPPTPTP